MEECAGKSVFECAPEAFRDTIFETIGETRDVARGQEESFDYLRHYLSSVPYRGSFDVFEEILSWLLGNQGTVKCCVCLEIYYCSKECNDKDHLKHQQVCKQVESLHGQGIKETFQMLFANVYYLQDLQKIHGCKAPNPQYAKVQRIFARKWDSCGRGFLFWSIQRTRKDICTGKHELAQQADQHYDDIRNTRRGPPGSNSHLARLFDAHIRSRVGRCGLERVQLVLAGLGPEHAAWGLPSLYIP